MSLRLMPSLRLAEWPVIVEGAGLARFGQVLFFLFVLVPLLFDSCCELFGHLGVARRQQVDRVGALPLD